MTGHVHEWERGAHMTEAFGIDGRRLACATCGVPKSEVPEEQAVPVVESDSIRVEVRRRDEVEDILWPKGWPLPEPGTILHGDVLAGWVEHCEYNIPAGRIIVVLRP